MSNITQDCSLFSHDGVAITGALMSIKEVIAVTTLSKSSIYRLIKESESDFPQPVSVTPSRSAFYVREVEEWLLSRPRI